MLRVHLVDGETLRFDLADEAQAERWLRELSRASLQDEVTALTLDANGVQVSLPRPRRIAPTFLAAQRLPANGRAKEREQLVCYAGDVSLVVTAHASQRAVRVELTRSGRVRYNPLLRKP